MYKISIACHDQEIIACYPIMAELRSHIKPEEFLSIVKRLSALTGFRLVYLTDSEVKAVAGIRIAEWLAKGKYLEIEDLVSKSGERSKGYGELFDWLIEYAKKNGCLQVRLVSHVDRYDAHRFYERKGMKREAYYFSMNVN